MFTENMTADQVLNEYRDDVYKLAAYLPWLEQKSGQRVSSIYSQDGVSEHSCGFPVYDSNLMRFIKDAENTKFMDRNYRYVYSRNHLRNVEDEMKLIDQASILQMDLLGGIMSNYVMGGRTKARLWSQGMDQGVFLALVSKAKELVDFWVNATTMEGR